MRLALLAFCVLCVSLPYAAMGNEQVTLTIAATGDGFVTPAPGVYTYPKGVMVVIHARSETGQLSRSGSIDGSTSQWRTGDTWTFRVTLQGNSTLYIDFGSKEPPRVTARPEFSKGALIISADNKQKLYDGEPFSRFTVSYRGFLPGDGPQDLEGRLSFSGTAIGAVAPGTYTIVPGGLRSSDYRIRFEAGQSRIRPYYDVAPVGDTFAGRLLEDPPAEVLDTTAVYEIGEPMIVTFTIDDFHGEPLVDATVIVGLLRLDGRTRSVVYLGRAPYDADKGMYCLKIATDAFAAGSYLLDVTANDHARSHFREPFELVAPRADNVDE